MMHWLDSKLRHKAWWRKWRGLPEPVPTPIALITQEALSILENHLKFASAVNLDYLQVAEEGRTIKIKRPTRYVP